MHMWYWESCYFSALPYGFPFLSLKKTIKYSPYNLRT
nr:MAG TPA: hypothetical protein [Caudoviricetes sp.]